MYWFFIVIIMAIVFLCGLMVGIVFGEAHKHE